MTSLLPTLSCAAFDSALPACVPPLAGDVTLLLPLPPVEPVVLPLCSFPFPCEMPAATVALPLLPLTAL